MERLNGWWSAERDRIARTLADFVRIDTTAPNEPAAIPFLQRYLGPLGFTLVERPIPDLFWSHPERCPPPLSRLTYGRTLLRAHRPGRAGGGHLAVNCHLDVVPLTEGFGDGFQPVVAGGRVTGRGAADTKGNLVMMAETVRFLDHAGRPPGCELTLDLVAEEETGGNGALASALAGLDADCALVLEPTGLEVFCGHRGCVTFEARFSAHATHMGSASGPPTSAIDLAILGIAALRRLETRMIADAAGDPLFEGWSRPLQINVGRIEGGEWHGSVPARCRIVGNCGFLPCHGLDGARSMLEETLAAVVADVPGAGVELRWPGLRNEALAGDPAHPFAAALAAAAGQGPIRAWNVSCDGRHYGRTLGLPTAIFGCGRLDQAHAEGETLDLADLARGIAILADVLGGAGWRGRPA